MLLLATTTAARGERDPIARRRGEHCSCDSAHVFKNVFFPPSIASPRPGGKPDARRVGDNLYVNGQIGEDLMTRLLVNGSSLSAEATLALNNTLRVLEYAGCAYRDVVLYTVYLADGANLALTGGVLANMSLNTGTPNTVYNAARGSFVGRTLPQDANFAFDYVAYACNWTAAARPRSTRWNRPCGCQQPYHHYAWDLPANVSLPISPSKAYRRVSRGGSYAYVTGTVGENFLSAGVLVSGGLAAQLNKSLDNVALQLAQAGCALTNIVQVTTLLSNWTLLPEVNALHLQYLGSAVGPFIGSEKLVTGIKLDALIQHNVIAKNCAFNTTPQYFF
ncbi:hypothetical protein BV898_15505 [Hypsibius exemplaris]|uniref:Uncharacterized protein n=1 Tax=Hypsibius exemplaris TaxID=2072580 RepID=A0A9X6RKE6_HYPEX|nr:hypothetical protein BV898_15505 [Hypsibius exemplaris]